MTVAIMIAASQNAVTGLCQKYISIKNMTIEVPLASGQTSFGIFICRTSISCIG